LIFGLLLFSCEITALLFGCHKHIVSLYNKYSISFDTLAFIHLFIGHKHPRNHVIFIFLLQFLCMCFFFFPSSTIFSAILRMTISGGRYAGDDIPFGRSSSSHRDLDSEFGRSVLHADTPAVVLQEIAMKCGTKVS
jgi:hypothetical protein